MDSSEKEPGDYQADPNDEAEKADGIDQRQATNSFGPKFLDVRAQTNGEKGHDEEKAAKEITFGRSSLQTTLRIRPTQTDAKERKKKDEITKDKLGKALGDFSDRHFFPRLGIDLVNPDHP
jgi:hypothetical protein